MDRGIPTEAVLEEMRTSEHAVFYLVGTPRSKIRQYEKKWLELPWQKVRDAVEVKLFADAGELYVLAKSEGRRAQERAMRRKKLARLLRKLRSMQRIGPRRDQLLLRIGGARKEAGIVYRFLQIHVPREGETVTRHSFHFRVDQLKLKAAELLDGHYLLRSNLVGEDPAVLWERYVQLAQIEAAFKAMKSELGIAPLPSAGASRRGPDFSGLPCLLPVDHAEESVASSGSGTHPPKRFWRSWPPFKCLMFGYRRPMGAGW